MRSIELTLLMAIWSIFTLATLSGCVNGVYIDGMEARAMYTGSVADAKQPLNDYDQPQLSLSIDSTTCDRGRIVDIKSAARLWWPHAAITTGIAAGCFEDSVCCSDQYPDITPNNAIVVFPSGDVAAIAHEMGHAIGLGHDVNHPEDALMGSYTTADDVTNYDVSALNELYGLGE